MGDQPSDSIKARAINRLFPLGYDTMYQVPLFKKKPHLAGSNVVRRDASVVSMPYGFLTLPDGYHLIRRNEDGSVVVSNSESGLEYFQVRIRVDGTLDFKNQLPMKLFTSLLPFRLKLSTLGLDDLITKLRGGDRSFHQKDLFARRTFRSRFQIMSAYRNVMLRRSLAKLPGDLREIYNSQRTLVDKRRLLFERWDECSGEKSVQGDSYEMAGLKARRIILTFIREKFPEGSPSAYSALELFRLNATRSSATEFRPYK